MKTKIFSLRIVSFLVLVILPSCEQRFTYYLKNDTAYTLDSAVLDRDHHFSLAPQQVAGPFQGVNRQNPGTMLFQPLFMIFVPVYSDSVRTYRGRHGSTLPREVIEEEDGTYMFTIVSDMVKINDSTQVTFNLNVEQVQEGDRVAER